MIKNKSVSINKYLLLLLLVPSALWTHACTDLPQLGNNFLEKPPSQDVNIDTVFTNADLAKRFLWSTYRSLPYGPGQVDGAYDKDKMSRSMLAALTDINQAYNTVGGPFKFYYTGDYSASVAQNSSGAVKFNYFNSGAWAGIRDSYIFINNIDRVPDMSNDTKARLKAEARMIIAEQYIRLFRNYGGVPWVDHAYDPNEGFQLPRMTAKATLDSTVAMIDRAIPDLPFSLPSVSTEAGRFTQAGAMGLKVRVLLFGASPLFNSNEPYMDGEAAQKELVWYGQKYPELWEQTAKAAKSLIDKAEQTGGYHLLDTGNPRQDFQDAYYDRDSPEILVSTRVQYQAGGEGYYFYDLEERGAGVVTNNYVRMFPMASGKSITDQNSDYDPDNRYENRDPRLYETVLINGDKYQSRTAETYIGGRERVALNDRAIASGFRIRKFVLDGVESRGTTAHWPLLRLPEIYLSYAEALNEINGGPTAEAYQYVNKVRNRVDLGNLPTGMTQDEFRDAVVRERVLELGFEEVRWYDLIRLKRKEDFTKTLYGMNICREGVSPEDVCEGSYGSGQYIYDRFELPARYWQEKWSPKWYLSAFPKNEVLKDYGLIQNPGWE